MFMKKTQYYHACFPARWPCRLRHLVDALLLSTCSDAPGATDWNQCWMPRCFRRPCPWSRSCEGKGTKKIQNFKENSSITSGGLWIGDCAMNDLLKMRVVVYETQEVIRAAAVKSPSLQKQTIKSRFQVCKESSWFHRVILYCWTPRAPVLNTQWAAEAEWPEQSSLLSAYQVS